MPRAAAGAAAEQQLPLRNSTTVGGANIAAAEGFFTSAM